MRKAGNGADKFGSKFKSVMSFYKKVSQDLLSVETRVRALSLAINPEEFLVTKDEVLADSLETPSISKKSQSRCVIV
ncbi:MAG: hypothetical protein KBD64_03890 [Gammaproteobacteria bacterium]|nr:hypothetical protein [Gammaproteobacteria bacterium]